MSNISTRYSTLRGSSSSNNTGESETVKWHWQILAFLSSWLILGGYLSFPALAVKENVQLAVSTTTLIVLTTACLAAGFSLSALVVFATAKHASFHLDSIFKPAISSCSLGCLVHVLTVTLNPSFDIGLPAGIFGTVLGVVSTLIYSTCAIYSSGRSSRASGKIHLRDSSTSSHLPLAHYRSQSASSYSVGPERLPSTGSNRTHWSGHNMSHANVQHAPYLGQYASSDTAYQPEQPSVSAPSQTSRHASPSRIPVHLQTDVQKGAFDTGSPIGPVHILPKGSTAQGYAGGDMVEAELTRKQMLNLLMSNKAQAGLAGSQATFKIELPRDELERAGSIFGPERLDLASPAVVKAAERARLRGSSLSKEESVVSTHGITITETPPPPLSQSDTVKSRDERRREIELGYT